MAIVLPTRWQEQPSYPVELDWSHGLATGLVLSVPLSHDRLQYQVGGQRVSGITGTKARRILGVESIGLGSTLGTGTTDVVNTGWTLTTPLNTWVLWFWRNGLGGNNLGRLIEHGNSTATTGWRAFSNNTVIDTSVSVSGGTNGGYRINHPTASAWHQWAWSIDLTSVTTANATRLMYIDGASQTVTNITSATGTIATPTDPLLIGNSPAGNRVYDGYHRDFLHYNRILSDAEIAELYRNPYQIYRKRVARIYSFPSGASGTTVSVPSGSLTLTGYAPTVATTANQTVAVPAVSLTLTGYAPTVSVAANVLVNVPSGTLTLTGYAPTVAVSGLSFNPVWAVNSNVVIMGGAVL